MLNDYELTNVATGAADGNGIKQDGNQTVTSQQGIVYKCEGAEAAKLTFGQNANKSIYEMTITVDKSSSVPAALKAADLIDKNFPTKTIAL